MEKEVDLGMDRLEIPRARGLSAGDDALYWLSFYPVAERFPQAAPDVDAVWRANSQSFTLFIQDGVALTTNERKSP